VLRDKSIHVGLKGKVYLIVVRLALLYGLESKTNSSPQDDGSKGEDDSLDVWP